MGGKFGHRQKARGDFSKKFHGGKKSFGNGRNNNRGGGEYRRSDFNVGRREYGENGGY